MTQSIVPTTETTEQAQPALHDITTTTRREGQSMRCRVESLAHFIVTLFKEHTVVEQSLPTYIDGVWVWETPHLPAGIYGYATNKEQMSFFGAIPVLGGEGEVL